MKFKNAREELETVYVVVMKFLKDDPLCRNSDKYLILRVTNYFMGCPDLANIMEYTYSDFERTPSFGSITRCRRKIQNDKHMYLPTIEAVRKARGIREEEFKKWNREV